MLYTTPPSYSYYLANNASTRRQTPVRARMSAILLTSSAVIVVENLSRDAISSDNGISVIVTVSVVCGSNRPKSALVARRGSIGTTDLGVGETIPRLIIFRMQEVTVSGCEQVDHIVSSHDPFPSFSEVDKEKGCRHFGRTYTLISPYTS